MHDVMIDIEALSTQLGAVVLTIGAVIFDPESDRIGQTFAIRLPAQEQIDRGALVDVDTSGGGWTSPWRRGRRLFKALARTR